MKRQALAFILLLIVVLSGSGNAVAATEAIAGHHPGIAPAGDYHSAVPFNPLSWIHTLLGGAALQDLTACTTPPAVTRIMPLGDSITRGLYKSGEPTDDLAIGYRLPLYISLRNNGYYVDFVGSQPAGAAYPNFDVDHEGHPGKQDVFVARNIYKWLVNTPADVILLHIGTNALDPDPGDVEQILNEIKRYEQNHPGIKITTIVARIIDRIPNNSKTTEFNDNVTAMISARPDKNDFPMVNMQTGAGIIYAKTPNGDFADNLHPYATGYEKMATAWRNALNSLSLTSCSLPPLIHSIALTEARVNQLYTYNIIASGKPAPTYELINYPIGMTIHSTSGLITWTPGAVGSASVKVRAFNSEGFDEQSFTIAVLDTPVAPVITPIPNQTATVGQLFTYDVEASGDPAPTFSLPTKPAGMTIDATTGLISWTPGTTGTFNVSVRATNSEGVDQKSFTVTVTIPPAEPAAPVIAPIPNQSAVVGQLFTYDVDASGNPAPTFSLAGTPPAGMTINGATGLISWTPGAAGSYNVTVQATNSEGSDEKSFAIEVAAAPAAPVITPVPNQTTTVGQFFTYDVDANGSPAPTFSLLQAPGGMVIDANTGIISWLPGTAGIFNVSVRASNSAGVADESFTIEVIAGPAPPAIIPIPNQNATVGQLFTYDVEASGSPAPTFSLTQKPAGMTINATTGLIHWTPKTAGIFNVTVRATYPGGFDEQSFTVTVTAPNYRTFLPLVFGR